MSTQIQITSSAAAAGITGQIQFNNGGAFGADSGFTFNQTTKALTLTSNYVATGIPTLNIVGSTTSVCPYLQVISEGEISQAVLVATRVAGTSAGATNRAFLSLSNVAGAHNVIASNDGLAFSASGHTAYSSVNDQMRLKNGNLGIGNGYSATARLDVKAQGALSTDIAFRVRNSADTLDIIKANGRGDVFIGQAAGRLTTGINNTFVGINSGVNNITGQENTAIGAGAGAANLSSYNTYLGTSAGGAGTGATGSVFMGFYAGSNSNAQYGVFIGYTASTTGGSGTVAIGYNAGAGTGAHNLSLGQSSGIGMTTGSFNTHLGYRSVGSGVTTGNYNCLVGSDIVVGAVSNNAVLADNQGNQAIRKDANHNVLLGKETALATNATNGFAYFPTCAGTPTGVPAASFTGKAPIVIDSTNNKMYIYTNSAWVALN